MDGDATNCTGKKIVGGKGAKLYYYRCDNSSAMSKITADSLCDFDIRLQIYELLKQHKGCDITTKKLSHQTLRFFLDFLLVQKDKVSEYGKFKKGLKRYGRRLVKEMLLPEADGGKFELLILYISPTAYKWLRLIQYKLFKRSIYVC